MAETAGKPLTTDDILGAEADLARAVERVDVPEWGGYLHVRQMTADEREQYDRSLFDDDGNPVRRGWRAKLVAATVCDEAGRLLFSIDQAELLGRKSQGAILRVYKAAARMNKLRAEDADAEKKDSAPAPADGST